MKNSELDEFALIQRIASRVTPCTPGTVGIGDDCAVIRQSDEECLLVTTDMLIEDIHFLCRAISPQELGYKSLAVNLSDIAAMGGLPRSAFLSLGLPRQTTVSWVDAFLDGFQKLGMEFGVTLLGGDTSASPKKIVVSVTVLGTAPPPNLKLRSAACPGDILAVTGHLGDSGGGLRALFENIKRDGESDSLIQRHHLPKPHVTEGAWLGKKSEVHAMMDISDGIVSDLRHILKASGVGAKIDLEDLPLSPALKIVSQRLNWNAHELAAYGGEDYCLLVAIHPDAFDRIADDYRQQFGTPLHKVGVITDRKEYFEITQAGKPCDPAAHLFTHFAEPKKESKK